MFFRTAIIAAAIGLVALPVIAQEDATLREAERFGQYLFELDRAVQAAETAGDDMRSFRRDKDIVGWVADLQGDTYWLTFVGFSRSREPVALYQIPVGRSGQVLDKMQRLDKDWLDPSLTAQFAARQRASNVEHSTCSNDYETIVMRDTVSGAPGWRAWLLPRSAFPDVFLMGGTYRADMSERGDVVQHFMPLAEGCSILQNPADADALRFEDEQGAGPNELHVYINRVAGKPLYVGSGGRSWLIENGRIRALD